MNRRCNYPHGCGTRKGDCELYDPRECKNYTPSLGWFGAILLLFTCNAAPLDTVSYHIYWRHDFGYIEDTVQATFVIRSGDRYYLKGLNDEDHWSDRKPIKVRE
jgi:hypothetical protein